MTNNEAQMCGDDAPRSPGQPLGPLGDQASPANLPHLDEGGLSFVIGKAWVSRHAL